MRHVYDAIDILIAQAVTYRNTLGAQLLGLQADITNAVGVAAEWVNECRHAEEMTDAMRAEEAEREPVTCARCLELHDIRMALRAMNQVSGDHSPEAEREVREISGRLDHLVYLYEHDEAEGCDHDARNNFTSDDSDDGPDSAY